MSYLNASIGPVLRTHEPMSDQEEGEIALDAVMACHVLDLNVLAFARDLRNIRELVENVKSVAKIHDVSSAASAYLGNKYGTSNTIRDSIDVISLFTQKGIRRAWHGNSIARSRGSDTYTVPSGRFQGIVWERQCNVKLYYRPCDAPMSRLLQRLYDYDIFPSYQNLWDLVPYSFVVDWFKDVGSYLDALDSQCYLSTINTVGTLVTHRDMIKSYPASSISSEYEGTFDIILYDRIAGVMLPPMPLSVTSPDSFHAWWEGAALILQRVH